jgi:peptide/nickel transport system substrate-binding protein
MLKPLLNSLKALAALGVVLAITSCGGGGATTSANTGGAGATSLTAAISSFPNDMNPYSPTVDNVSLLVWNAFWEYLVQPSNDGSKIIPMLAQSWTVSPDGKTYRFVLRPGVKFSDGKPLTTGDVTSSLHNAFTQSGSQIAFLAKKVASVTAPTPTTIEIKLHSPWAYLLDDLSGFNAAILPQALIKGEGYKSFLAHPVGTGPFKISSISPGSSITMVRNPYYWDPGKPHLHSITFQVVDSDVARANAVQGGTAQVAMSPPGNQVSSLEQNSAVHVYKFPGSEVETLLLNTQRAPLNNPDVRKAISLAMDRAGIVKAGLFGFGTPASTFLVGPAPLTLQNISLNLYSFDLSRAAALMKASGVKTPVTIPLTVSSGTAQQAIATIAQQDLAKIGIQAKIIQLDYGTAASNMSAERFTMITNNWDDYVGDASEQPLFWIDPAFCCAAYFTNYVNPSAISLVRRAVAATNPTTAAQLFDQVQQSVATTAHAIPLYYPTFLYLGSSKLTGFNVNPFGTWSFPDMALTK